MQFALKLLINRDYAFLWAARTVSNLGDWVFVTSVTLWIATGIAAGQSWAPLAVGGVGIAVAVPTVSIGPLAGVFVDRWDKRRTMITADLIRFGLMATLILVPTVGTQLPTTIRLGAIYTVIVLATVCGTFFGPAQIGLLGFVVPPEERTKAASLSQLSVYLGLVLGPPLAAPLLFGLGPAWGLAVNAASFLVSAIAVRAIAARAPGAPEAGACVRGVLRDFVSGLRFIAKQRVLRALLVSIGEGANHILRRVTEDLLPAIGLGREDGLATQIVLYDGAHRLDLGSWAGKLTFSGRLVCERERHRLIYGSRCLLGSDPLADPD